MDSEEEEEYEHIATQEIRERNAALSRLQLPTPSHSRGSPRETSDLRMPPLETGRLG